jgi:hypothetical protein
MPRRKKSQSYKIVLDNIDGEILLSQYYNIGNVEEKVDKETDDENINFLHEKDKKRRRGLYFIDPQRGHVKLWATMIDFTIGGILPRITKKPCWFCRNKFNTQPIGCPIKYNYTPKNPVIVKRVMDRFKEMNICVDQNNLDFFETEGIFCSFPCVKAYILDQISKTKSSKYKKSLEYLSLLYFKINGEIAIIQSSPNWKLTSDWGGHLSSNEYRASIGTIEYLETTNVLRPYMFCSSNWIREKKIKL